MGLPRFLTPEEAALVLARIEHDRGDAVEEKLTWALFASYIQDWKLWEFPFYLLLNVKSSLRLLWPMTPWTCEDSTRH